MHIDSGTVVRESPKAVDQPAPVRSLLARVSDNLDRLEHTITAHEERITTALVPTELNALGRMEQGGAGESSQLVSELEQAAFRLEQHIDRLQELTSRVQL